MSKERETRLPPRVDRQTEVEAAFAVPGFMRAYIPGQAPGRKFTYFNIRGGDHLALQRADLLLYVEELVELYVLEMEISRCERINSRS